MPAVEPGGHSLLIVSNFREDSKNRYIPRISRDFLHFLAFEGNTDQLRPQPVTTAGEECKSAIEVTATHADAVLLSIECNERSDDDVQLARIYKRPRDGFPETEVVSREVRSRQCLAKKHAAMRGGYGEENALFCAPGALDNCTCIYLVPGRQVTRDRRAAEKVAAVEEPVRDSPRRPGTLRRRHGSARFPCIDPDVVHRY